MQVVYDPTTGKILQVADAPPESLIGETRPHIMVDGFDPSMPNTHWVNDGVIELRQEIEAEWDPVGQVLSPLPIPCTVRVDGVAYVVTDGSAEFTSSGTYKLYVEAPAYIPRIYEVVNP